jgi:hypothetical protein
MIGPTLGRLVGISKTLLWIVSTGVGVFFLTLVSHAGESNSCQILLVPGALGREPTWLSKKILLDRADYFAEYADYFESQGCRVARVDMPAFAGVQERAGVLRTFLEQKFQSGWNREVGVQVIGHSQAGLDARYLIAQAEKAKEDHGIRELVTIATPHRGSQGAKVFLERRSWILTLLGPLLDGMGYSSEQLLFLEQLTPDVLAEHSNDFAASPDVRYASAIMSCRQHCSLPMRLSAWSLGLVGDSDGVIESSSQDFGEDLGVYELDHISAVDRSPVGALERQRLQQRIFSWIRRRAPR